MSTPGGRGITVILNSTAGSADGSPRSRIEQAFARARIAAEVRTVTGPEVHAAAERAAADGSTLVAAGGDGTVSTVASVAAAAGVTFGVVPLGTLNHFAKDAGIPLDLDEAAQAIAAGFTRALDIGVVNDHLFVNNVGLGLYVRIVRERERQQRQGRRKWTAFAIGLANAWVRFRTLTVRLDVEGTALVRQTPFVFIGNGDYKAEGLDVGSRTSIDAGRLLIYVAPEAGRFDLIGLSLRALAGRLTPDVKLEEFSATEMTIEIPAPRIDAAIDGELVRLRPPLTCVIRPGALRTLVPRA